MEYKTESPEEKKAITKVEPLKKTEMVKAMLLKMAVTTQQELKMIH